MTYRELINNHLKNKPRYAQLGWVKKMIKILKQIENPDIYDKTLLVILNDFEVRLS